MVISDTTEHNSPTRLLLKVDEGEARISVKRQGDPVPDSGGELGCTKS